MTIKKILPVKIMSKSATILTKIDPKLKENVEHILANFGLTTNQAITLFLKEIELQKGLPFSVNIPNQITQEAIAKSKNWEKLDQYTNTTDLYNDLGI